MRNKEYQKSYENPLPPLSKISNRTVLNTSHGIRTNNSYQRQQDRILDPTNLPAPVEPTHLEKKYEKI